ncbi:MAG: MBL fold metallo-hydrolase [Clostridia bacterium]|nr:MBL fold metallo-hydrolase [Clostridia bacterium]
MHFPMEILPHKTYAEMAAGFLPNLLGYYEDPEKYALPPFRIFGNLYYVGDKQVCCHLVDTGDGLILFDTGYAHTMHLLLRSIKTLGFRPEDIKIIIHSHGHFDHFGSSARLKALYGCKIYMGRADAERLRVNPRAALMELSPEPYGPVPETDVALEDGDVIALGNTRVRCVSAPGHTEGVMAFFFDAIQGETTKQVGYFGGVGFFTIYREHLEKYGLPLTLPLSMKETIEKLKREHPEITIGNHPANNKTVERYAYRKEHPSENPFLDASVWEENLRVLEIRLQDFLSKNY